MSDQVNNRKIKRLDKKKKDRLKERNLSYRLSRKTMN